MLIFKISTISTFDVMQSFYLSFHPLFCLTGCHTKPRFVNIPPMPVVTVQVYIIAKLLIVDFQDKNISSFGTKQSSNPSVRLLTAVRSMQKPSFFKVDFSK